MWIAMVHTSFNPQHSVFIAENTDVPSPFLHLLPPRYACLLPTTFWCLLPLPGCRDLEEWGREGESCVVLCFTHRKTPKGHGGLRLCLWHSFLFIYFYLGLCRVFVAALGLSVVVTSRGYSFLRCAQASHCDSFSCCGAQALGTRASFFWTLESGDWKWDNINIFFEF